MEPDIMFLAAQLRQQLQAAEQNMRAMHRHGLFQSEEAFKGQHGEMRANIQLAVRHTEDARMRLGKLMQYAEDGVSILDKEPHTTKEK